MVYEWTGKKTFGLDPNVAGAEVERIVRKHGSPDAAVIVEESKRKTAPLHPAIFGESDKEAALAHRRSIARRIVSSLVVVQEAPEGESRPLPAFYSIAVEADDGERGRGYQSREVVLSDGGSKESAEQLLLRQLNGLRRRYDGLEPFQPVWEAVEQVEESLAPIAA